MIQRWTRWQEMAATVERTWRSIYNPFTMTRWLNPNIFARSQCSPAFLLLDLPYFLWIFLVYLPWIYLDQLVIADKLQVWIGFAAVESTGNIRKLWFFSLMSGTVATVPQVFAVLMCPTGSCGKIHDAFVEPTAIQHPKTAWLAAFHLLPDQQRHWASRPTMLWGHFVVIYMHIYYVWLYILCMINYD